MVPKGSAEVLANALKCKNSYDVTYGENACVDKLHWVMTYSAIGHELDVNRKTYIR